MSGLNRVITMYGSVTLGKESYVWDYVNEVAIPETEMPIGSDRWKESERAKWNAVKRKIREK